MARKRPTTLREWLSDGGTEEEWYHIQRNERGLERPAPPPWQPILMLHEREQPNFPIDALPKQLRDFAVEISQENQTPVDLAATAGLAVFSATLAKMVRVATRNGQSLPVNLFVANITQGSLGEERVIGEVRNPFEHVEMSTVNLWRENITKRQCLRRQDKNRLRRLERLGMDSTRSRDEALELAVKIESNPIPALPRLIIDDTTPGRLEKHLLEQNGKLAAFYGEGAILDLFTGTQSKRRMANREIFRRGHRGESFLVEQRGGTRALVDEAAITCQMAVPQSSIEGLQHHRSRRGRGVLDCFLFSMPKKNVAKRKLKERESISPRAIEDYTHLILSGQRNKTAYTLNLSNEARHRFQLFEEEVEEHLMRHPEEAIFRNWLDRLPEQTLRIAAVLHSMALFQPDIEQSPRMEETISLETVERAVKIARYFIPHAEAALGTMHCHWDDATDGARYLLDWFMQDNVKSFTRREAHQRSRARFSAAWEIDAPLNELVRRGYIRPIPDDPTEKKTAGRTASQRYEVQTDIYYVHRHPDYPFGEIGAPIILAEVDAQGNSEHKPHAPRAHEEQTPNPIVASIDEAKSSPKENCEHDRRKSADQEPPINSEHGRRKRKYSDAPSVKQFKKKNAHLLKRYREKVVPLIKELEQKVAEEKAAEKSS